MADRKSKPRRTARTPAAGEGGRTGEEAVLAAIAKMPEPYRTMGGRLHRIISASAPELSPRTWYGMPAYAKGNAVVCYFRGGDKFKERYLTLGFNDDAQLDDGEFWPISYALTGLSTADEERIAALVKRAVCARTG